MTKNIKKNAFLLLAIIPSFVFSVGGRSASGLHTELPSKKRIFNDEQWKYAKVAAGLAGTAGISYAADRIVGKGDGSYFYNGKYADGYSQALKVSGAFLSLAPMLNEQWGDQFFRFGTRAPIVGMAAIGIAHPVTQKFALHIPFGLGEYLSTYTKNSEGHVVSKCGDHCEGVCTRCWIPKALLVVGLYKVIDPLVDQIGTYVGEKFGFIQKDEDHSQDI